MGKQYLLILVAIIFLTQGLAEAAEVLGHQDVGVNTHFYHHGSNLRLLNLIEQIGAKYVREEGVSWVNAERTRGKLEVEPGIINYVNRLNASGIRPVFILSYANKIYAPSDSSAPNTPELLEAFGRYAAFLAKTFKGKVYAWEIWNEPDSSHLWQPKSNSKEYSLLVKHVAPLIRQSDPGALIVAGALGNPNRDYLHSLQQYEALGDVDVISLHWYTYPKSPDDASVKYYVDAVRSFIVSAKQVGKQVWITEMGYPTSTDSAGISEAQQADYLAKQLKMSAQMGVDLCFIYDLIDDGTDKRNKEYCFGVFRSDFTPKPAAMALRGRKMPASSP